jgi:hypothetical protein
VTNSDQVTSSEASKCLKTWWPGTDLNRRRQTFQGWLNPELSVESAGLSQISCLILSFFIGAKTEPSCTNLSLPRFASTSTSVSNGLSKSKVVKLFSTIEDDEMLSANSERVR